MPIKNLTDRGARFPKLGTIRKGEPRPESGKAPGRDTNYFRLDTPDEELRQDWIRLYGENPQSLPIVLPYRTTEENFPSWMEEWKASSMVRRCDGEFQFLRLARNSYDNAPVSCMAPECNCKPVGRLTVVLPALKRLGYLEVQTHSKWDLLGLSESLQAFELSIGSLQGIPLILSRREREISSPKGDGSRMRVKKWLLHLEISPHFSALLLESWANRNVKLIGANEVRAIKPSDESWKEKGIAWAIAQGITQEVAIALSEKTTSKREFFSAINLELEKRSVVNTDGIVDFQTLDGDKF